MGGRLTSHEWSNSQDLRDHEVSFADSGRTWLAGADGHQGFLPEVVTWWIALRASLNMIRFLWLTLAKKTPGLSKRNQNWRRLGLFPTQEELDRQTHALPRRLRCSEEMGPCLLEWAEKVRLAVHAWSGSAQAVSRRLWRLELGIPDSCSVFFSWSENKNYFIPCFPGHPVARWGPYQF